MGGVLLIGYEMYRMFYTAREGKAKRTISKKKKSSGLIDLEEEELVDRREKEQLERKFSYCIAFRAATVVIVTLFYIP